MSVLLRYVSSASLFVRRTTRLHRLTDRLNGNMYRQQAGKPPVETGGRVPAIMHAAVKTPFNPLPFLTTIGPRFDGDYT